MREGWEYKKLGDVVTTINGLWTGKKPPFINVAVIRNTNFTKDCELDMTNIAYIDVEQKQYSTRKLLPGDIIIEKSGGSDKQPVGRAILFNINEGEYSFSNFTSMLRIVNNCDLLPTFLHKFLQAKYRQGVTRSMQAKTIGIHNLDFKAYKNQKVPLPPLSTQQSIVSELDKINELISLKKSQLEDLDSLAQSIFYDMFGDPVENEKGWEVKKIGDICTDMKYGTSKPACINGQYKYLRMCNLTYNGYLDLSDIKTIDIPDDEIEKCIVRKGDILFNRTNSIELVGKTCMFEEDEPMVIAGYIIRVRLNEYILPVYLTRSFNLPSMKKIIRNMAKGAVNQANINSKQLASIHIPLPPLSLQQTFAKRIEVIEQQKQQINKTIKDLETLLASRMQYWFD